MMLQLSSSKNWKWQMSSHTRYFLFPKCNCDQLQEMISLMENRPKGLNICWYWHIEYKLYTKICNCFIFFWLLFSKQGSKTRRLSPTRKREKFFYFPSVALVQFFELVIMVHISLLKPQSWNVHEYIRVWFPSVLLVGIIWYANNQLFRYQKIPVQKEYFT